MAKNKNGNKKNRNDSSLSPTETATSKKKLKSDGVIDADLLKPNEERLPRVSDNEPPQPPLLGSSTVRDGGSAPGVVPSSTQTSRLELINSQLNNRYSDVSAPPYVSFVEVASQSTELSDSDPKFIGNFHPMAIGKRICNLFNSLNIREIKRMGRNLISVVFDSYQQANIFVDSRSSLPKGWVSYIPNFKLYRAGVLRDVDRSLSLDDIRDGITWPGPPVKIISLERLKYRARDSGQLLDSSSIKIIFESHLLPECLHIWRIRHWVNPYINNVRKCQNCSRLGHSTFACRSQPSCAKCSAAHHTSTCNDTNASTNCINCGGDHEAFSLICPALEKFKIINTIMAFTNCNMLRAKKILKTRNFTSTRQASLALRSSAFMGWNMGEDIFSVRPDSSRPFPVVPPLGRPTTPRRVTRAVEVRRPSFRPRLASGGENSTTGMSETVSLEDVLDLRAAAPALRTRRDGIPEFVQGQNKGASSIPLDMEGGFDTKNLYTKNNPVVGALLSEIYCLIRSKKQHNQDPEDIVADIVQLVLTYQSA